MFLGNIFRQSITWKGKKQQKRIKRSARAKNVDQHTPQMVSTATLDQDQFKQRVTETKSRRCITELYYRYLINFVVLTVKQMPQTKSLKSITFLWCLQFFWRYQIIENTEPSLLQILNESMIATLNATASKSEAV